MNYEQLALLLCIAALAIAVGATFSYVFIKSAHTRAMEEKAAREVSLFPDDMYIEVNGVKTTPISLETKLRNAGGMELFKSMCEFLTIVKFNDPSNPNSLSAHQLNEMLKQRLQCLDNQRKTEHNLHLNIKVGSFKTMMFATPMGGWNTYMVGTKR